MSKLKIGIVGTGSISKHHITAYLQNPNVELIALCDINKELVEAAGKQYGVTNIFYSADDMLKMKELDAVSICVWNSEHAPCAIKALKAGKHVLCEKPMATTAEQALLMQQAAKESGKLLMIGFVRRFGADCAMLKEFMNTDELGELYYAKATYLRRNGNPGGWFGDKSRSGGGPVIDLGVHVIDLVRYLFGNPKPVSVYAATFQKLYDRKNIKTPKGYYSSSHTDHDICDVEDLASALIRFDNGAVLSVETSFSLNVKEDVGGVSLYGTKGGVSLSPKLELFKELNDYMVNITPIGSNGFEFQKSFDSEINHFVDCILNETPCKAPAQDGVEIMRILSAIYQSAETGHEVIL